MDTFRVMASNGLKEREAEVSVLIASVDSELPVLITTNSSFLYGNDSPHLSLFRDATVAISEMTIRIEDTDSPKSRFEKGSI